MQIDQVPKASTSKLPKVSIYKMPESKHEPVGPEGAPLWRITAASDPNTTPLELMHVWAVEIDPRKSKNYMQFSRSVARRLKAAEQGGDANERSASSSRSKKNNGTPSAHTNGHSQNGNGQRKDGRDGDDEDEGEGSDQSDSSASGTSGMEDVDESLRHLRLFQRTGENGELFGLVCRVADLPSYDDVLSLLKPVDVTFDGTEPKPFQVEVPNGPAPSRNRLPEWKKFWPVSVKYGRVLNSVVVPSLSGQLQAPSCSASPGVVDRALDAQLWTPIAKEWAIRNFRKCLRTAWQAEKNGDVPIGVHVTSTYPEGGKIVSGVGEGQKSIEVHGWDTRRSERNPIKHAVTNAIREVAKVRSERDWERLLLLNAKVANLYRDPHANPDEHRLAMQKAEAAVAASMGTSTGPPSPSSSNGGTPKGLLNGQDYLLNNLSLFITHEPCVHCCMALVHSRVRAIYFIQPSPYAGGCCGSGMESSRQCKFAQDGGPYAVQEQQGLNHRFDVWRWVGNDDDLRKTEYDIPINDPTLQDDIDPNCPNEGSIRLDHFALDA
ncbi:uncharacterized protein FA14DRAFT_161488 [Meira miltonrushii]|uniref:Uncharacterized protein n=1 Tax=Meira miltonrushii TaxID=1280837 RepID=A0A316V8A7_9BASI|nr:uncharacterized protein FA14DRAFT_161488 [Meira miltonrushii]PWN33819.1 hypothetical protein FA14DRAFT_161488 [Meira miltonrushii]